MDKNLHSRPNLEHLRGQAKELLNGLRDRNPNAAQTFKQHLPAAHSMDEEEIFTTGFRLADAQSVIARQTGFAGWPRLAHHIQQIRSFEGDWSFEYLQVEGAEMAPAMYSDSRILIDGDKFRTETPMVNYDGEFNIDVEKEPHEIDINFVEGPHAGKWSYGIYRLEGDSLTICLGLVGANRPAEFATSPGSGHALETLQRVTTERPTGVTGGQRHESVEMPSGADTTVDFGEIPIRPDHQRLEGDWSALKIVVDGKSIPAAILKDGRRVGRGAHVTVTLMGQVMVDADYWIHEGIDPIEVDYITKRPDGTRYAQQGIMRWDGDDITSCFAAPGLPRPSAFESPIGSGFVLSTWRRIQSI